MPVPFDGHNVVTDFTENIIAVSLDGLKASPPFTIYIYVYIYIYIIY